MGLGPDFTNIQNTFNVIYYILSGLRKVLKIIGNLWSNNQTYKQVRSPRKPTATSTPKSDTTNKSPSTNKSNEEPNTNSYKQCKARQPSICQAIKNGTFKIKDYKSQVPENACVYHGWLHHGQLNSTKHSNTVNDLLQEVAKATTSNNAKPSTPSSSTTKSDQTTAKTATGPTDKEVEEMNDALDTLTKFGDKLNNNNNTL